MRLLLGTSNISKGATSEQRAIVEQILQNPSLSNDHSAPVQSVSIEIEEGSERMILTLLDTPGFHHNELDLERAVTTLVRLVGARYDETLNEVSWGIVNRFEGTTNVPNGLAYARFLFFNRRARSYDKAAKETIIFICTTSFFFLQLTMDRYPANQVNSC